MESSRSKRRRLMTVSSYGSPRRRPDLPATFESLNDDTLTTTLEFVGDKSYKSFGGTNKRCKEVYITSGMTKETFVYGYAPLSVIQDRVERVEQTDYWLHETGQVALSKGVLFYNRKDVFDWALQERKTNLLRGICVLAAEEGRLDILNEILNNNMDGFEKNSIFCDVDGYAAIQGKLDVLKWFEKKGLHIFYKENCAMEAARHGHLHILKWLREKKGLELDGDLYNDTIGRCWEIGSSRIICSGHLNILRWLREMEVPWDEWTFLHAAYTGKLNVLQWLHDEGCPWPEVRCVLEEKLKSETLDWCRVNGYHDRIVSRND